MAAKAKDFWAELLVQKPFPHLPKSKLFLWRKTNKVKQMVQHLI